MDVFDAIQSRYSVRKYADRKVEEDTLKRVLEAARLAPSASNRQEWRFIVVQDPDTKNKLSNAANNQSFVAQAPVVVACCAETDGHVMSCGEPCYPIDVAIAVDHLTLAATALGLGTCWIGAFNADGVKKLLGIPPDVRVVELLTIGYPADGQKSKKRLPMEKIVRYEKW
jgi:nitroreductase